MKFSGIDIKENIKIGHLAERRVTKLAGDHYAEI